MNRIWKWNRRGRRLLRMQCEKKKRYEKRRIICFIAIRRRRSTYVASEWMNELKIQNGTVCTYRYAVYQQIKNCTIFDWNNGYISLLLYSFSKNGKLLENRVGDVRLGIITYIYKQKKKPLNQKLWMYKHFNKITFPIETTSHIHFIISHHLYQFHLCWAIVGCDVVDGRERNFFFCSFWFHFFFIIIYLM